MDWKFVFGLTEKGTTCHTHKKQKFTVNSTLSALGAAALALMVYHILTKGPVVEGVDGIKDMSFIRIIGYEIWETIMGSKGVFANLLEGNIWLYFLVGNMIASWIRTYKFHIRMRKTLVNYGFLSIVLATLIGIISPLCSCGILTTVVGLLSTGLPLAPAMALLISAPLMSPSTYMITIGDLGAEWAFIRMIAAASMGLFAGLVTYALSKYFVSDELFIEGAIPEGDFHDENFSGDERLRCSCGDKFSNRVGRETRNKFIIFWAKTIEMTWMIGKYVLIGLFVGNVVERYIDPDTIARLFSEGGLKAILYVTFGSIPLYLHQVSASSVLVHIKEALPGTLDKGAALAFLIGGPVTAIPAMTLLWAMFKKRVFFLYMAISLLGTVILSVFFAKFIFVPGTDASHPLFYEVSQISGGKSSVIKKNNEKTKILISPDRKNTLAVYDDTIMGGSGVVFDSMVSHYLKNSYDNSYYVRNIADWLEKTVLTSKKKILVYSTYVGKGIPESAFRRGGFGMLKKKGYSIDFADRTIIPVLDLKELEPYSQVWIISGEENSVGCFSEDEVSTIVDFRDDGYGLLFVSGSGDAEKIFLGDINQLASEYEVVFIGYEDMSERIPISTLGKLAPWFIKYMHPVYTVMQKLGSESAGISLYLWKQIKNGFSFVF